MNKLAVGLLLAAVALPAAAQERTLTVWDFKSAEPLMQPYFDKVHELFNAKHPDVTIKQIAQPGNNYYVLLGTAINANEGPDVALLHNGADALTRAAAFVPLDDEVADIKADIVGWESFRSPDGTYVAVPISVQGVALYYNKEVYTAAGLDPEKAPQTWEELTANCEAIAKTGVTCFGVGNKDGVGFESAITAIFDGLWSEETRQKFIKHELSWTSPEMKAAFDSFDQLLKAGWVVEGANSYNPYTDIVNQLVGGRVAHMFGLVSDAPNSWRNVENLIEPGNLGVAAPVAINRSAGGIPAPADRRRRYRLRHHALEQGARTRPRLHQGDGRCSKRIRVHGVGGRLDVEQDRRHEPAQFTGCDRRHRVDRLLLAGRAHEVLLRTGRASGAGARRSVADEW